MPVFFACQVEKFSLKYIYSLTGGVFMEVLAIIPARGGSKGIPGKNIKMLAGRPLIDYTIKAGQRSKYITRTVLSTESEKIKEVALQCGVEVIDRPMELAQDETKTIPVMIHAVEELKRRENYFPDAVILLQATCPLRDEKQIDEAFEIYLNNDCDSVFAVTHGGWTHAGWRQDPHTHKFEALYDYRNRPRRQDVTEHYNLFWETGSIYICDTKVMFEVNDFIGKNPLVYVSPTIDIDTPDDFEKIEQIIMQKNEQYSGAV